MRTGKVAQLHPDRLLDYAAFAEKCLQVESKDSLCKVVEGVNHFFQFEYAICGLAEVQNGSLAKALEVINVSYPPKWIDYYFNNSFHLFDPIVNYHFKSFTPKTWEEIYELSVEQDTHIKDRATDFGVEDGVIYGLEERFICQGSLFSFSGISTGERTEEVYRHLRVITPFLHIALKNYRHYKKKIELIEQRQKCEPLTERETEVLNWMAVGKSNWEISSILGISERTVKFHVLNVLRKLHVSTRSYAVAKAIHLALIKL